MYFSPDITKVDSDYFTNFTSKYITTNSSPEYFSEFVPGQTTIKNVSHLFYPSVLETFLYVADEKEVSPSFYKEVETSFYKEVLHKLSLIRIVKVEKNFVFNKDLTSTVEKKYTSPSFVEKINDKMYSLVYNNWTITLQHIRWGESFEPVLIEQSESRNANVSLIVKGKFFSNAGQRHIMSPDRIFGQVRQYESHKICPCLRDTQSAYADCCREILFGNPLESLATSSYRVNDHIDEILSEGILETFTAAARWEKDTKLLHPTIVRKVKGRASLSSILDYLFTLNFPRISPNDEEILKKVNELKDNLEVDASYSKVWMIYDTNNIIIEIATTQSEKEEKIRELYLNIWLDNFYTAIANEYLYINSHYPNFLDDLKAYLGSWNIPSALIKNRIIEAVQLFQEGRFEAASYVIAAQIEAIIRIGITREYGALKTLEKGQVKRSYLTLRKLIKIMPVNEYQGRQKDEHQIALKSAYIRTLCDWGSNIRNNLYHGFEEEAYDEKTFLTLLHLTLRLKKSLG